MSCTGVHTDDWGPCSLLGIFDKNVVYKQKLKGVLHCASIISLDENAIARSILLGLKNARKGGIIFLILRRVCFLTFFDTSKTQRARPFPSFSHKPHANQDHKANNIK